ELEGLAVLLSSFYRLRPETTSWLSQGTQPEAGRRRWSVLPISVDGTTLPEELEGLAMVDLAGMGPERARAALLTTPNWAAGDTRAAEERGSVQPRFPATPPRISRIPLRNPSFTGRRRLLATIRNALLSRPKASSPLAIAGLGGVGKTQVAIEYAHRFAADY